MIRVILICLMVTFSLNLSCQQMLKHEKRLYIAPNGKYYLNQRLPVFLNITTSDTPTSKQYKLKSEKSPQHVNPIKFGNEGHNPIRVTALSSDGKSVPVFFDIHIDGTPPLTTTKMTGAKNSKGFNKEIYGPDFKMEFLAKDKISGVENIYISVNKETYKPYKTPLTFTKGGSYEISYYSSDNVGNIETPRKLEFKIDVTPPVTTCKFEGPKHDKTLSQTSKIILEKKDDMSGGHKSMYAFDNAEFRTYSGPINCGMLKDGQHSITFYSIDEVGNTEDSKKATNKYSFYLDRTIPTAKFEFEGVKYTSEGHTLFINKDTKIKIASDDNHSGVDKITYQVKSSDPKITIKETNQTYSSPFTLSEKGPQIIIAKVTDKIGLERKISTNVYMDNVKPKTGIKYGKPRYFDDEKSILCISQKTFISFFTSVYHSGIKNTMYKIDEGSEIMYRKPFHILKEGKHKIIYKSEDNVKNIEDPKRSFIIVDNTPPTISIRFPSPGKQITMGGKSYKSYPPKSRMYLDVKDNLSSIKSIYFTVNGGSKIDYNEISSAVMEEIFFEPIVYKIVATAKDVLSNTKVEVFEFAIVKKLD